MKLGTLVGALGWVGRGFGCAGHAGVGWGKGGGRKRKNHVLESVFFFVVCPYGPLKYPCQGQGRR